MHLTQPWSARFGAPASALCQRVRAVLKADTSARGEAGFSRIGQALHSARLGSQRDFPV